METVKQYTVEDQSKNGVRVTVYRFHDGGTTVDADCSCHGTTFRAHSHDRCPVLLAAKATEKP
jgi:hypothetical protein